MHSALALRAAAAAAVAVAVAASAPSPAAAATIHACYKPRTGAVRIVGSRTRCHRGEQRLSWGTSGPAGPQGSAGATGASGAPGAEGRAGADGAVSAFSAVSDEPTTIAVGKESILLTKTLPPGDYVVFGKAVVGAEEQPTPAFVTAFCGLLFRPEGGGKATNIDISAWGSQLGLSGTKYAAIASIDTQGTLATKVAGILELGCNAFGTVALEGTFAELQAIGVSSIG